MAFTFIRLNPNPSPISCCVAGQIYVLLIFTWLICNQYSTLKLSFINISISCLPNFSPPFIIKILIILFLQLSYIIYYFFNNNNLFFEGFPLILYAFFNSNFFVEILILTRWYYRIITTQTITRLYSCFKRTLTFLGYEMTSMRHRLKQPVFLCSFLLTFKAMQHTFTMPFS